MEIILALVILEHLVPFLFKCHQVQFNLLSIWYFKELPYHLSIELCTFAKDCVLIMPYWKLIFFLSSWPIFGKMLEQYWSISGSVFWISMETHRPHIGTAAMWNDIGWWYWIIHGTIQHVLGTVCVIALVAIMQEIWLPWQRKLIHKLLIHRFPPSFLTVCLHSAGQVGKQQRISTIIKIANPNMHNMLLYTNQYYIYISCIISMIRCVHDIWKYDVIDKTDIMYLSHLWLTIPTFLIIDLSLIVSCTVGCIQDQV